MKGRLNGYDTLVNRQLRELQIFYAEMNQREQHSEGVGAPLTPTLLRLDQTRLRQEVDIGVYDVEDFGLPKLSPLVLGFLL